MTLHSFFYLSHSSYPHNLFYAYAAVWIIQGGYLASIARNWMRVAHRND